MSSTLSSLSFYSSGFQQLMDEASPVSIMISLTAITRILPFLRAKNEGGGGRMISRRNSSLLSEPCSLPVGLPSFGGVDEGRRRASGIFKSQREVSLAYYRGVLSCLTTKLEVLHQHSVS